MNIKKFLIIAAIALSLFAFAACESEGPAEKAGKKIDQTVKKAADSAKETGEAIQEKVEDAGQAIEEKVKKATE